MATWYARQSSVNINAANVWNDQAGGGGNWLTWPPAADDVLNANGFTAIAINVDVTVATMTCQGSSGTFTIGDARTITANLIGGNASSFLVNSGSGYTVTINGNLTGGTAPCLNVSVAATVNITGNVTGGSSSGHSVTVSSASAVVNVTGNVTGGSASGAYGINASVAATISVTGNVTAATGRGFSGQNGTTLTVTSGNVVDTATLSAHYGAHFRFNPGPTNYMRVRTGDGSTTRDLYYTPTDAEIATAVWSYANRTLTG